MSKSIPGYKSETSRSGESRVLDVDGKVISVDGKARAGSSKPAETKKNEPNRVPVTDPAKVRKGGS